MSWRKYKTFSVPIEKKPKKTDKDGNEDIQLFLTKKNC